MATPCLSLLEDVDEVLDDALELAIDEAELLTEDFCEEEMLLGADDLLILEGWLELEEIELLD